MNQEMEIMRQNFLIIRKWMNVSASELGKQLGVSRQAINNIERGRTKMSKPVYLLMLRVIEDWHQLYADDEEERIMMKKLLSKKAIDQGFGMPLKFED